MTPMPPAAWLPALLVPAAAVLLAACSTPDPAQVKAPQGGSTVEKRDTEIKHEPCDGNASSAARVDVNGDGKPDIIHVMNGQREVCRLVDLNLDGAMDAYIYYEADGVTERRRESDFDRDGRPDEIALFSQGVVVLKMRETNFDEKLDTWDYYEGGRLSRRERDSDGDSTIDQWWTFNNPTNPKCAIVAADRNGDGKPDPESVVDLCGDAYGTPHGAAPGAPGTIGGVGAPPGVPPGAPALTGSAAPPAPGGAAVAPPPMGNGVLGAQPGTPPVVMPPPAPPAGPPQPQRVP